RAFGIDRDADRARRALDATYAGVDEIGEVTRREAIDCGYVKAGAVTIATSAPQLRRLEARARGLGADRMELLSAGETAECIHADHLRGGLRIADAARLDPARLVRGLAEACERRGVRIYERTAATAIERGAVRCGALTVRAPTVLRATESYTTQLPGRRLRYLPLYSLMIATAPLSEATWAALGWRDGLLVDDGHYLFFYAQRTTDGRIAIGGRGAPYRLTSPIDERNERDQRVHARLSRTLVRAFPVVADVPLTHHWGGPLAVPRDWTMSVTFDRASGLGAAGGYTGHGVVASNVSGRTLADLVLGRDSDLVTMPWVGHRSRSWEPEPIRFLASEAIVRTLGAADRREDATDRAARRVGLLRPFLPPR
ncbi:MAG: NAD(P)/FAD-dependent oxidoreductase, partial [Solirubrobacteraceae bacterium]